jgi:hypothetical protein
MKLTTSNQYWIITKIIEERKNKMNQESNNKELLAELETYRWRYKKATILKELGFTKYLSTYNRDEIIKAYKANRPFTLFDRLFINEKADDLILKGYEVDEIIKAVMEWVKERLDEIKIEKEEL